LHEGWKFRVDGKPIWRSARVPGCVHSDLMSHQLIPDPFFRDNEEKIQWVTGVNWEYRLEFDPTASLLQREQIELVFEGLDTYATAWLNGKEILRANNMFRSWRIPVKNILIPGKNQLRIIFRSSIAEVLPQMKGMKYQLPAPMDRGEKTSPFTRKASYQYGWDWGPRLVTSGLWRPVYLEAWDQAKIENVQFEQTLLEEQLANLKAKVRVYSSAPRSLCLDLASPQSLFPAVRLPVRLSKGINPLEVGFEIPRPRLWWPNGLGEPSLYEIRVQLSDGKRVIAESKLRLGLRTLQLRQQKDAWGKSFEFVVNGIPVFAKGANWIPPDSFPSQMTPERYRHLLNSAQSAHMNMLRVWGGGFYEDDVFYELCDELGIMVWQDFMFACSLYPGDKEFVENVSAEVKDQTIRLRNHPSLVLWCGNNEIETAWQHWGWKEKVPAFCWNENEHLFTQLIPSLCEGLDPARPYWSSSPSSNREADPDSQNFGDLHYWGVWHGQLPFDDYKKQSPRFMSEYGVQSLPDSITLDKFTWPGDRWMESPVLRGHQKQLQGNQRILEYLLREFPQPKDFASLVYLSQLTQACGVKIGAEHLRCERPRTMGSLFWQYNDCWPAISWSSIDYGGHWKALQYYARRFYQELLVSINEDADSLGIYIVSDRLQVVDGLLGVCLMDFEGNRIRCQEIPVKIPGLSSAVYIKMSRDQLLLGQDPSRVFLRCELKVEGKVKGENHHYFLTARQLKLPDPVIKTKFTEIPAGLKIELSSEKLARDVYLSMLDHEGFFSENYFDLAPGQQTEVIFHPMAKVSSKNLSANLKVVSLASTF
jgi:beta-mannosidase